MRIIPLNKSQSVTLDFSGNGTAELAPGSAGEVWQAGFIVSVHVLTNSAEALCRVYCGAGPSPAYFTDGTTWGSTGDSTSNTPELRTGNSVFAVWSGGDPGGTATLTIHGMRQVA